MKFPELDTKSIRLLKELWRFPLISRTDLVELTALDPAAVSRSMAGLLELKMVTEVSEGDAGPQGGRKPVKLCIHPDYGIVLGLEFHSVFCDVVFVNFQGKAFESMHIPNSSQDLDLLDRLKTVWDAILLHVQNKIYNIMGMTIGFPGIVDPDKGLLLLSNPLEITQPLEVVRIMEDYCGLPVLIENDVRCCCFAELSHVKHEDTKDFMFVLGEFRRNKLRNAPFDGIALGLGLVLDGKIFRGDSNAAGEFRSVYHENLPVSSQFAIPDEVLIKLEHSLEVQKIFSRELGRNLALVVNILNLPKLVFGGSLSIFGQGFLDQIRGEIEHNWQYPKQGNVTMQYSAYGDHSVAYGAAIMFLFHILSI